MNIRVVNAYVVRARVVLNARVVNARFSRVLRACYMHSEGMRNHMPIAVNHCKLTNLTLCSVTS